MRAEPILKIKDGRHFLQERMTESYIPNDTAMMGGERRHFSSMVS
jgi:DNA mismatch repair ATPase MutS